jgi:CHAT domain-containing protein/tetratricopeptide (TPR) repeat protein
MFGFLAWRQKRLGNRFQSAYGAALESRDMHERVAAAQYALGIVDKIEPWPFSSFLPKQRAIGKLHGALGRALMELRSEDPPRISRLVLAESEKALEYLTPEDGADWATAMSNLSTAYADSLDGSHGDNIERAIKVAQAALGVVDRERHRTEWINAMANLAGYYAERTHESRAANIEMSIQLHEAVLEEVSKGGPPIYQARLLLGLGSAYAERRRYDKEQNIERAIGCLEKAFIILSLEDEPDSWAMGQHNLSRAYSERIRGSRPENFRRAIKANDLCLFVFESIGAREKWARAQRLRLSLFENCPYGDRASNLREAIEAGERALSVFSPEEYPEEHAQVVMALNQARSRQQGDGRTATMEEIIEVGEAMLSSLSPKSDPDDRASTLVYLGNAYAERIEGDRSENIERSVELLEQAVALLDERAHPVGWAGAMNGLAQSYQERIEGLHADNIEKSLALCEAALVVVSNLSDPDEHSALLETLGGGFFDRVRGDRRENLERAIQVYDSASRRRDREQDPEAWLRLEQKYLQAERVLSSLTRSEKNVEAESPLDVEQRLASLHAAADIVSADDHPRTWMAAQLYLADTYTRILPPGVDINDVHVFVDAVCANCRKALELYEAALPVVERMGDKSQWALLQDRIGGAYGLMHLLTGAQINAAVEDSERRNRYVEQAHGYYLSATAAHAAALEINTLERSPRKHLESAVNLGRLHTYERDWVVAEEKFASAARAADRLLGDVELSDSDMKGVLEALGQMAAFAPFVSLMLDQPARAVELAEIGRARLLAKVLTLESLPLAPTLRNDLHTLQRQVAVQERRLVSPRLFDRQTPLDESMRLRREIRTLVKGVNLSDHFEGFAASALDALLTDGSVVVLPVLTEAGGKIVICIGRNGKHETHVAECHAAGALRRILESPNLKTGGGWQRQYLRHSQHGIPDETLYAVADALGEAFATPLVQALESLGVSRGAHLDILPQGSLGILPLGLARDGRSGQSLLECYELSLSPSLTALRHAKKRASVAPVSLVSLANPTLDLKFAEPESDLLRNWFRDDRAQYEEGHAISREEILKALPGRDVWHFATHGRFNLSAPLQSSLALGGNDFLTLEMLFETSGLGTPRLVVLSACESGLYDLNSFPDEFIGLACGFLQAGAAGVIATLWPVDDLSTTLLMGRFYEGYVGERLTPSAALRAAQLWLRDASRDDVFDTLSRWGESGRVSSIGAMMDTIGNGAGGSKSVRGFALANAVDEAPSEVPFASPAYWGGLVHYGV